jgi:hypothetical protein
MVSVTFPIFLPAIFLPMQQGKLEQGKKILGKKCEARWSKAKRFWKPAPRH